MFERGTADTGMTVNQENSQPVAAGRLRGREAHWSSRYLCLLAFSVLAHDSPVVNRELKATQLAWRGVLTRIIPVRTFEKERASCCCVDAATQRWR